jgi:polyisoprenoid-binding protein YceI
MADFKPVMRTIKKRKSSQLLAALAAAWLSIAATTPSASTSLPYRVTSGKVTFTAIGKPGFLRVNGRGAVPGGIFTLNGNKGLAAAEISVKLDAFETGIAMRDRHMKEIYLETGKFPEAKLVVSPVTFAGDAIPESLDLKGDLTLHGKSLPVTARTKIKTNGDQMEIESAFDLKLSDFGIAIPEYAGVTVADTVKVDVTISAIRETTAGKK